MEATVKGYCVKCRTMREMAKVADVEMKTGRKAKKGTCSKCGTGMYKIMPGSQKKSK